MFKNFYEFWENPIAASYFERFLEDDFSRENAYFLHEAHKFRTTEFQNEEEKNDFAEKIYQRFVRPGAEEEINIDHGTRTRLRSIMEWKNSTETTIPIDSFVPAEEEVFTLLKFDPFVRFQQGHIFLEMMIHLRSLKNGAKKKKL
eukprot:TRINITY_DN3602_c0_g1_i3.p1 TRINITY_DN3602_c0_g1~~TRINITY_DN3602_c0_g1_i3.p1  ORF type:complete len:145 (-),score=29.60 TRINITY_DN3602_c0_g1_i3:361-795(-)